MTPRNMTFRNKPSGSPFSGESEFVQRLFAPLAAGHPGAFGLEDDAAVVAPAPGEEFVVTTDTIIAGVHFLPQDAPESARAVARKALGVNVSDLVAKGAVPRAYLLALALPPSIGADWLQQFAEGLAECQNAWGLTLVGGDTTRGLGPLAITITALGSVPAGRIVRRSGARSGDRLFVTGTIGDAGLGLALARGDSQARDWPARFGEPACRFLVGRYERPEPRIALNAALLQYASAALDISDGLLLDLRRLCRASAVGAHIELARLPVSEAAASVLSGGAASALDLATAGDDYEVLCAVPESRCGPFQAAAASAGVSVTGIGGISAVSAGVTAVDASGKAVNAGREGWDHFAGIAENEGK